MRANFSWLEDISVRLLCVLALDRFGDFVGDGVVAPVRETGGSFRRVLRDLPTRKVFDIGEATLTLLKYEKAWEVRHSGLIGLKYVFASIPQGERVKMDMLVQKLLLGASEINRRFEGRRRRRPSGGCRSRFTSEGIVKSADFEERRRRSWSGRSEERRRRRRQFVRDVFGNAMERVVGIR